MPSESVLGIASEAESATDVNFDGDRGARPDEWEVGISWQTQDRPDGQPLARLNGTGGIWLQSWEGLGDNLKK